MCILCCVQCQHVAMVLTICVCTCNVPVYRFISVADTGGLQWFQLQPPLKIARAPNLLTSRRVSDR